MDATNVIKIFNNKVKAHLLTVIFKADSDWVAYIPALELTTQGNSPEDAKRMLKEMVEIYFEEVLASKTIFEDLSRLGWQLEPYKKKKYILPKVEIDFNLNHSIIEQSNYSFA